MASLALRFPPSLNPRPKLRCILPSPQRLSIPRVNPSVSGPRPPPASLGLLCRKWPGFVVKAGKDNGFVPEVNAEVSEEDKAEAEARGQSTLPERFRYLTKEVPEKPVRWPWLIAVVFLVYAWRTVLWELSNWKKTVFAIVYFIGYIAKIMLAFVFHFIGSPITAFIECIEFSINFIQSIYSSVVTFAPVPELSRIILLTSAVLAIAEATSPNAVNDQPYLLTAAGLVGFGAVRGVIPEGLFGLLLIGLFSYSKFVRRHDGVSAALPSVAALVAIGEPWVRTLAMSAYLAFAIFQHSRSFQVDAKDDTPRRRVPVPLLLAALAIGINLAAKWIRHRHLTWMIV